MSTDFRKTEKRKENGIYSEKLNIENRLYNWNKAICSNFYSPLFKIDFLQLAWYNGNAAQRASGDFARHLLANFPSEPVSYLLARILRAYFPRYFGKILENPQRIFSVFPFISQKIWRRNLHTSDTKQTLIFHKNAREYIKYSLRFLFHLTKNLTTHLSHNLCAVLP